MIASGKKYLVDDTGLPKSLMCFRKASVVFDRVNTPIDATKERAINSMPGVCMGYQDPESTVPLKQFEFNIFLNFDYYGRRYIVKNIRDIKFFKYNQSPFSVPGLARFPRNGRHISAFVQIEWFDMEEEYQKVTWERLTKTLHKSIKHLLILDEFRKYEEHVALVPGNFEAFLAHVRERELIGRPFRYFRSRDISVQFLRDRISLEVEYEQAETDHSMLTNLLQMHRWNFGTKPTWKEGMKRKPKYHATMAKVEQAIQNQKKRRADKAMIGGRKTAPKVDRATIGRKGTPKVHRFTMGRKGGPKLDRATIGVKGDKSHRAIIINDEMETVVRDTVEGASSQDSGIGSEGDVSLELEGAEAENEFFPSPDTKNEKAKRIGGSNVI